MVEACRRCDISEEEAVKAEGLALFVCSKAEGDNDGRTCIRVYGRTTGSAPRLDCPQGARAGIHLDGVYGVDDGVFRDTREGASEHVSAPACTWRVK